MFAWLGALAKDIDDLKEDGIVIVTGRQFLTHMVSMYIGVRGYQEILIDLLIPVMLNDVIGASTVRGSVIVSLAFTPWAMKPLFAVVSDCFAFFFHKKRWYMTCITAMSGACAFFMSTAPADVLGAPMKEADDGTMEPQANTFLILICVMQSAIAMCDSLSQGKYTEICKWKGSSIVSFTMYLKTTGYMLASIITPIFNDTNPQFNLYFVLPLVAQAIIVQAMNFMGDRRQDQCCFFDSELFHKDKGIILLGLGLGIWALILAIAGLAGASAGVLLGMSAGGLGAVLIGTFSVLPTQVAKVNTYMLFCRVAYLDLRYVLQQWYTAPETQCPDSPHFPNKVYQLMGYVMGNLASLFGVFLFERYVSHWNARPAFWVTTVFTMVASLFDVMMVTNFNRVLLGWLPFIGGQVVTWFGQDYPMRLEDIFGFLIGSQAIKNMAVTLDDMPATVLLSKICPPGVETTVFAMLAAMQNMGLQMAGLLSSNFLEFFEVNLDRSKNICDLGEAPFGMNGLLFSVITGNMILPLTTILATWALIPNKRLDEDFVGDSDGQVELTGGASLTGGEMSKVNSSHSMKSGKQGMAGAFMRSGSALGGRMV